MGFGSALHLSTDMGSNINFGSDPSGDGGSGGRHPGNFPLTRQSSIYSLTFDEFQNTLGGSIGKDFGSMNMDELLKNIWSAEENQNAVSSNGGGGGGSTCQEAHGYLQRQGSLTLPRTLSQKTVDEVWRDISKEYGGAGTRDSTGEGFGGFVVPPRQPTLGEITLEEFLFRAGVVSEEAQLAAKRNNAGILGDLSNGSGLGFGFHQPQDSRIDGLMTDRAPESSNQIALQSTNLPLNGCGVISAMAYGGTLEIASNGQLSSPAGTRGGVGTSDPAINNTLVQNQALHGGGLGLIGLAASGAALATGSPAISPDGLTKSNGDTSSISPVPYVCNGGFRGRKSAAFEKVVERRQRRMIKNRESAARSRARKQAYTTELEAEVAKLKEENEGLQKRQKEMMEMHKNQVLKMMNRKNGAKKRCLRRMQTGPW